ncbi:response regulator [bacterium]|nr:response regulator [candidate division CSSED10-310 bacterium]
MAGPEAYREMNRLPPEVTRYLHRIFIDDRHAAILQLDSHWTLTAKSGDLIHHGLEDLPEGRDVSDALGFVRDMIPEPGQSLSLPCVRIGSGPPADIFLLPSGNGVIVIFLDATEKADQQGKLQQATNQLRLLQAEQVRLLRELEDANLRLTDFNTELERRVAERTAELRDANDRLRAEIKERQTAEEQLRHAQKMEAIGQLAGGVAHDFNNLMTVVIGYSEMILASIDETDPIREDIREIAGAGEMASDVARQLLAFSRKQVIQLEMIDLNTLIGNLNKMLSRLIGADIRLETDFNPDLETIAADPGQMEQVVMNLVINARDAMPEGGKIVIRTENVTLDAPRDTGTGQYVQIIVQDTGTGIDPVILDRIFEPFFTTKSKGKGTGLGLSVVYGIIKQHNGWIDVESALNRGTTFTIYLPVSDESVEQVTKHHIIDGDMMGKGQIILLIEDDPAVQKFASRILNLHGYTTKNAGSAKRALELFRQNPGEFSLVFSDIMLPDMNGLELAKTLLGLNPKLRILITTGYTGEKADWESIRKRAWPVLPKPYDAVTLLSAVKQALDESA